MNVVFIGAPGAGKGTQAKKLVEEKGFRHLSTGDLFRENFRKNTSLGQKAKLYVDRGELVPDSVTNEMVESFLKKEESAAKNIIFDGWPRNLPQAEALDRIFSETGRVLDRVIFFEISDHQIVKRLSGRLYAPKSGCVYHVQMNPPKRPGFCDKSGEPLVVREDDREDLILSRLKIFHKDTEPLLSYYQKKQETEQNLKQGTEQNLKQGTEQNLKQGTEQNLKQETEQNLKQETEQNLKQETEQRKNQKIKQGIKQGKRKQQQSRALLRAVQAAHPPEKLFLSILQALD